MLIQTTAPTGQIITTADAKARLNVAGTAEDAMIAAMIATAQAKLDGREGDLNRALLPQSWQWTAHCFEAMADPDGSTIYLPLPPSRTVTEIAYVNTAGATVILSPSAYVVIPGGYHGDLVIPAAGTQWPTSLADRPDAARIKFDCGYLNAAAIPPPIGQALFLMVGDMYAQRETFAFGVPMPVPMSVTVEALLDPYRVRSL
jgi:uncharacterized phiE125 gp8 family phage protein